MRKVYFILFFLTLFFTENSYGQKVISCDTEGVRWLLQKDTTSFVVNLPGEVESTTNPSIISINNQIVQYLVVNKSKYLDQETGNEPLKILIRHAYAEAEYMSKQFGERLELQMVKAPLSDSVSVLVWSFKMPKKVSKEVQSQIFATLIVRQYIVGLSSPQFADQPIDSVRNMLMDIISTLKMVDDSETVCQ